MQETVHGYEIKRSVVFDDDRGYALAENPNAVEPFVTWALYVDENGHRSYEWGHYFSTLDRATQDYMNRITEYHQKNGVTEKDAYRYYSTQRPVDIGTFPKTENGPIRFENFSKRESVEQGRFEAWGYLVYDAPLTKQQAEDYELRPAPWNADAVAPESKLQSYTVTITETLKMEVVVAASDPTEAEEIANENWDNEDYVLDASHFVGVDFEARPTVMEAEKGAQMEEKITVLLVRPMLPPQAVEIDNTLKAMQQAVGGDIEAVYPFDDRVTIICNEEGKLLGLQPCRGLFDSEGQLQDILVGNFFLCGENGDNFASLTAAQLETYAAKFAQPEDFVFQNGRIVPAPMQAASEKQAEAPPPFKKRPKRSNPSKKRGGDAR